MSKINELIKELCPNGVEYKTLDKVCKINKGKQLNKDGLLLDGMYPVINGGITPSGYWNEYNYDENLITISQGGASAGYIAYHSTKFWAGAHCYVVENCKDYIVYKYLYHFLKSKQSVLQSSQVGAGIPSVSLKEIYGLKIPIPPIEVQEEIIRILDKFGKLEAELEARKSQYEFWRDKVFEPKDTWTSKTMEELCTIITKQTGFDYSATIKPSLLDSKSDETYSFIQNKDFDGIRFNFDTDYYIPKNVADKYPKITLDCPSILFSISGKIGNVGLYESEKKAFIGGAIAICKLKPNLNNKYILYYLQSKYGQQYLFGNIKAASHLNVTVEAIRKINIRFPSLDEQKKIVNMLDKFECLTNDILVGLPAEIELRRKQYEYYRNKLLSFEGIK